MLTEVSVIAAFLVGLLGGVHCIGMCGGIVGAISLGGPESDSNTASRWSHLLAYNAGRITSYTLGGALLGGVAWIAANWTGLHQLQSVLHLVANLFMIALGMYLAGWWHGLAYIEQAGGVFWKQLEPLGRKFLPINTPRRAFALGLIWGWLPCGLVYSVLVWAVATGTPWDGAMLMLSFGIGTLPNLLAMGLAANTLASRMRNPLIRQIAGLVIMAFGSYSLVRWFIR